MFVTLQFTAEPELAEILQAELAELGFDAFLETENGFEASVAAELFNAEALEDMLARYRGMGEFSFGQQTVAKQNWNSLWESNYPPIEVGERCLIRATFHEVTRPYEYQILISPKMSFGTGHHATTWQIVNALLDIDCTGKKVFDAGTGTGILAILTLLKGASDVSGCDIDEWSVENALENAALNGVSFRMLPGTTEACSHPSAPYDIFIANINLHVILAELPIYARLTAAGGTFITSGFYEHDVPAVVAEAQKQGFTHQATTTKDNWACVTFKKG